jgi:hypothetical protein
MRLCPGQLCLEGRRRVSRCARAHWGGGRGYMWARTGLQFNRDGFVGAFHQESSAVPVSHRLVRSVAFEGWYVQQCAAFRLASVRAALPDELHGCGFAWIARVSGGKTWRRFRGMRCDALRCGEKTRRDCRDGVGDGSGKWSRAMKFGTKCRPSSGVSVGRRKRTGNMNHSIKIRRGCSGGDM